MKKLINDNLLINVIAALFILLFMYTGLNKINEHVSFQTVLSKSPLLESSFKIISWLVPIAEILTSVFLFFPATRKLGLLMSLLLMTLFTFYISYMLLFTPQLPCSCGGVLKEMNWTQHFFFNVSFVFLAICGLWLIKKNKFFIAINRNS